MTRKIDLTQLAQSGATNDQVPVWDGTNWIPSSISGGGGGGGGGGTSHALVVRKTANQSFSGTAFAPVTFDAVPDFDSNSAFDGTSDFTVPADAVAMEVNFRCNWTNNTSGTGRFVNLTNATTSTVEALEITIDLNEAGQTMNTGVIPVTGGHVYRINAVAGSGTVSMSGNMYGGPAVLTVRFYRSYSDLIGGNGEIGPSVVKPLLSGFTLENAGTAVATDGVMGIMLNVPSSTVNIRFLRQNAALPGASWQATMKASTVAVTHSNFHHGALLLRDSVSGRIINFAHAAGNLQIQRWNSYTSYASAIATRSQNYGHDLYWKRVQCDGTTLTFSVSNNGLDWQVIATEPLATWLSGLDQVGMGCINGNTTGIDIANLFESFEVV